MPKMLIVDDEPDMRKMLKDYFEHEIGMWITQTCG